MGSSNGNKSHREIADCALKRSIRRQLRRRIIRELDSVVTEQEYCEQLAFSLRKCYKSTWYTNTFITSRLYIFFDPSQIQWLYRTTREKDYKLLIFDLWTCEHPQYRFDELTRLHLFSYGKIHQKARDRGPSFEKPRFTSRRGFFTTPGTRWQNGRIHSQNTKTSVHESLITLFY